MPWRSAVTHQAERRIAAIDFGASNTDVVVREASGTRHWRMPSVGVPDEGRVRRVLATGDLGPSDLDWIAVTGGNPAGIPATLDQCRVHRVDELQAIGRGGLALSACDAALVVSAGSGTAMVAASRDVVRHVTDTGVGGGTLVGLARLLLDTVDAEHIDALAQAGTETTQNLTIGELLGGAVGSLPAETTAVHFGRVARESVAASPTDTAAALVNMVGQVIAVLAINAARAQGLSEVVMVGHLSAMPSMRRTYALVAQYYGTTFRFRDQPGMATALGALLIAGERQVEMRAEPHAERHVTHRAD